MPELEIGQDLHALNDRIAAKNRRRFAEAGVFVVNIIGSPGSGKTTLLEHILPPLQAVFRVAVIEGDPATQNDAERIQSIGVNALQINTDGGCHLAPDMVQRELPKLDLQALDLSIIENVGNLVCPIAFDLGEHLRLVVLSTPEGEDKPLEYPRAMLHTDAVVITKTDLAKYVDVDLAGMKRNILQINPKVCVLEAGKVDGSYTAASVIDYLVAKAGVKQEGKLPEASVAARQSPPLTS